MNGKQHNRNRNTYMIFIAAGVFVLLTKIVANPGTVIAIFMVLLGFYSVRNGSQKKGYVLIAIGAFILVGSHFMVIVALVLMSMGFFYLKSRQVHGEGSVLQKTKLIESLKRDKEPWILRSMSLWYAICELRLDFSLAIPEEKETVLVLQGIIGDIDIIIPEDMGLTVQSSLVFGQLDAGTERESGMMNKIYWQSPNYHAAEQRVKLLVSYIVGDIDIKVL
ncbi:cell wall-active antibiotics response protein LiaF [Gorillibacterium sp. sgz5001074]|uniref:cell wall-active antibiotics response protein LiaF n=1 Tax=Gorillibacterium sp. sgz5001074 TaxID=3446695 RepID=UPI003F66F295